MEILQNFFQQLSRMQLSDYVDIIAVACLIFFLLPLFRSTGTARIAKIVVVVLVITWLTDVLNLHTLNFILNQLLTVGLIAIVVLFQPELRRMVDRLSSVQLRKMLSPQQADEQMVKVIQHTVRACQEMSKEKIGALIVFARDSHIEEYLKSGTMIDAQSSEHLIRNIFFPKAALHDGAMIIRDGRVLAAGCVLPLSESELLNADLGTRHRAAVGMSEASDAVVVVVSEETGVISVAIGGMLKRHLAPQTLERLLRAELCDEPTDNPKTLKLLQKFHKKDKGGN